MTVDPHTAIEMGAVLIEQDALLDGMLGELQKVGTEMLTAIADNSERINPDGWLHRLVREYLDVWR